MQLFGVRSPMKVKPWHVLLGLGIVLGGWVVMRLWPVFRCHEEIAYEVWAPDRRHVATLVMRDCGATTSAAAHIVVSTRALRLPVGGKRAICVTDDSAGVRVRWKSAGQLVIRTGLGEVFRAKTGVDGIRIAYGFD